MMDTDQDGAGSLSNRLFSNNRSTVNVVKSIDAKADQVVLESTTTGCSITIRMDMVGLGRLVYMTR